MTANCFTQRWYEGTQRWRPTGEQGFEPDRYGVAEIGKSEAQAFVRRHHYSATFPASKFCFGLWDLAATPRLVGALVLGIAMHNRVLTNPFPHLEPHVESLEVSRLVLLDEVPANGETWFAARCFHAAAELGVRGVVAFSDPMERWEYHDGGRRVFKPGHVGIIYQAGNFSYLGRATPRTLTLLPDGTVLTARAQAKVTSSERGAQGVIARLVALSAPEPEPAQNPADWLHMALRVVGAQTRRHPGNHRYALRIGRTRAERTRTVIAVPARPYPKPETTLELDIS